MKRPVQRRPKVKERTASAPGPPEAAMQRLSTRVPGLDEILGGGLRPGRMYLIEGRPGAGKTVLAAQLCFEQARRGDACVFVTTLSESHTTLLSNLEPFEFFDRSLVDDRITFLSGYQAIEQGGLEALTELIALALRKTRARVLVIDTLTHTNEVGSSLSLMKRFIRDIAALCSLLGCTAVCIAPPTESPGDLRIEQASDGILELSRAAVDLRTTRTIEISKLRGSPSLDGKHAFTITNQGISIYPRIEARLTAAPPVARELRGRVSLGVGDLDEMLRGGVMSASSTAVIGAPGAGKTLLGLHFLAAGARAGERCLYFGFYETPPRLIAKAEEVGLAFADYVSRGDIELLWQPALEYSIDYLSDRLLAAVDRRKVTRLVVDGMNGFRTSALYESRIPRFFGALTNALRARETTSLFADEIELAGVRTGATAPLSGLFENILLVRYEEKDDQLRRVFSIVKVRESDYDTSAREFLITKRGLRLVTPPRRARATRGRRAAATTTSEKKSRAGARRRAGT